MVPCRNLEFSTVFFLKQFRGAVIDFGSNPSLELWHFWCDDKDDRSLKALFGLTILPELCRKKHNNTSNPALKVSYYVKFTFHSFLRPCGANSWTPCFIALPNKRKVHKYAVFWRATVCFWIINHEKLLHCSPG